MLFDLRGRGRRRTVQVIYLSLALLLGGGLVLFGIGGEVSGGLVDGLRGQDGDVNEVVEDRVDNAEARVKANPRDAGGFAELAEARFQLAGQSKGFDENAQGEAQFTGEARRQLELAERAWDRHLDVAGDRPNQNTAATMRNALVSLGKPEKAVGAQEIILEGRGDQAGFGDFAILASLAYEAGQTRKGDLAAKRATELAPKDQRSQLKQQLDQAKAQAITGAAQGGTGGQPAPTPTPTPAPAPGG